MKVLSWDDYFVNQLDLIAMKSKDPHTQVGAIIVGANHEIRSTGYNSFPRGINDDVPERCQRPEKYKWIEHAERNAIYNAAMIGTSTADCTIYIRFYPCVDCARGIINCGIKEVVIASSQGKSVSEKWYEDFEIASVMFKEANIKVRRMDDN